MKEYINAYKELYKAVYEMPKKYKEEKLSNFVTMKGERYDVNKDVRFMIVGRATNGWGDSMNKISAESYAEEASKIFDKTNRFYTDWNMKDIKNNPYSEYRDVNDGKEKRYYLSKSAFWSSAKNVWCKLNGVDNKPDWFNEIVWSNIYKVAPFESGNPSTNLIYAQAPACVKILKEEIDILKPTHILLAIDKSWISWTFKGKKKFDFMEAFKNVECCKDLVSNNQNIVQKAFVSDGIKVIVTRRPESLCREEYATAVYETFYNMK